MEIHINEVQAVMVGRVLAARVREIDQIECNNEEVRAELKAERRVLVGVLGEIWGEVLFWDEMK